MLGVFPKNIDETGSDGGSLTHDPMQRPDAIDRHRQIAIFTRSQDETSAVRDFKGHVFKGVRQTVGDIHTQAASGYGTALARPLNPQLSSISFGSSVNPSSFFLTGQSINHRRATSVSAARLQYRPM